MSSKEIFKLITIHGDVIIIEVDKSNSDNVSNKITDNLDSNSVFYLGNYQERAMFKGHELNIVDFKKIIGIY